MAKEKIVVIDDSPIVRKLAELALEEEGYKVYTAEDGEEGLRICEEVRPSVILVDFIMPRISGYQFCEAARDNELLKDIPIILITGKGEDVGKKFAEKFGVIDYFIKPFKSEILVEKVNALIYAQKLQSGEVTLPKPPPPVTSGPETLYGGHESQQQSVYGMPDAPVKPVSEIVPAGPEPVEDHIESFKFDEAELTQAQPVDLYAKPGAAFEQPPDPFALPDDPFAQAHEAFAQLQNADNESVSGDTFAFPGTYDFEPARELKAMQTFGSSMEQPSGFQPVGAIEETLDAVMRRYFTDELPDLIEQNMDDILRKYGLIKDSSILLSGNLQAVSGTEILRLIDAQRMTGKFFAYSSSGSAEIYFAKGAVVFALTSRQGKTLTSKRIAIIKKGPLNEVGDRTRESMLDAVLMVGEFKEGGFFFEEMVVPKAMLELNHRSNVTALVLEALRSKGERADEAYGITVSSILVRTISDTIARGIGMNASETEMFSAVDGKRSVSDIGSHSDLGMTEVTRILSRLHKAGVVADKGGL